MFGASCTVRSQDQDGEASLQGSAAAEITRDTFPLGTELGLRPLPRAFLSSCSHWAHPVLPSSQGRTNHCCEVATPQNRNLSRVGAGRGERRQGGAGEGRAGPGPELFHCSPGLGAVVVPASLEEMTGLLGTGGLMASSGARSSLVLPRILAMLLPCLWGLRPGPPAQCAHLPCLLPWLVKLRVGLATHMLFPGLDSS